MMAAIHDRMPVLLDERGADDWMNPRETNPFSLKRMLRRETTRLSETTEAAITQRGKQGPFVRVGLQPVVEVPRPYESDAKVATAPVCDTVLRTTTMQPQVCGLLLRRWRERQH
jgi:hypothetical protein